MENVNKEILKDFSGRVRTVTFAYCKLPRFCFLFFDTTRCLYLNFNNSRNNLSKNNICTEILSYRIRVEGYLLPVWKRKNFINNVSFHTDLTLDTVI